MEKERQTPLTGASARRNWSLVANTLSKRKPSVGGRLSRFDFKVSSIANESLCRRPSEEVLPMFDDFLLIQEIKARLISSEVESDEGGRRRGSVPKIARLFDNACERTSGGDSSPRDSGISVRSILERVAFEELRQELQRRLKSKEIIEAEVIQALESSGKRLSDKVLHFLLHEDLRKHTFSPIKYFRTRSVDVVTESSNEKEDSYHQYKVRGKSFSDVMHLARAPSNPRARTKRAQTVHDYTIQPESAKILSSSGTRTRSDTDDYLNVLDQVLALKSNVWQMEREFVDLASRTATVRQEMLRIRDERVAAASTG